MKTTKLILFFVLFISVTEVFPNEKWKRIEDSIEYKQVTRNYSGEKSRIAKYHVFRIKQGKLKLSIKSFHNLKHGQKISISDLRRKSNYLIVCSGGFFDPDFKNPVGLLVKNKIKVFNLTPKLSGTIWIKDNHLNLSPTNQFDCSRIKPDYAIQGYPMIVDPVNKLGIYKQSHLFLHRIAIGTARDYVFIIITDRMFDGVSLYELAIFAQNSEENGGLNCEIAINLDGGPAPGISVATELYKLEIKEGWQVPNVFIVERM